MKTIYKSAATIIVAIKQTELIGFTTLNADAARKEFYEEQLVEAVTRLKNSKNLSAFLKDQAQLETKAMELQIFVTSSFDKIADILM